MAVYPELGAIDFSLTLQKSQTPAGSQGGEEPGIVAGSMLVFIPVVGEYIIPEMLGGSDKLYFGKIIWDEFFVNRDWPIASALAMSGIVILVFPIIIFQLMYAKYNFKNE